MFNGATRHEDVQFLGGNVVAETITFVLTRPQLPRHGVKRQPSGVAQTPADDLSAFCAGTIYRVANDRRSPLVSLLTEVAG